MVTPLPLILHRSPVWTITAAQEALCISGARAGTPDAASTAPTGDMVAIDLGILLEQELAEQHGAEVRLPWAAWPRAHALGVPLLTNHSRPSHLALRVDRRGEVGRPDFRYLIRWMEGHREVAVERHGAYLLHGATNLVMHLEPRMLELVEATDGFNRRPENERTQPSVAWRTLGAVQQIARQLGMVMDSHLTSNEVVAPGALGFDILQSEGSITFRPRITGSDYSDAFAAAVGGRQHICRDIATL